MTALPNKCYSGCHKATEEEDDRETPGKEIWRGICGQRASDLAGGRWRRQHKTERGGDEWKRQGTNQKCTVYRATINDNSLSSKALY